MAYFKQIRIEKNIVHVYTHTHANKSLCSFVEECVSGFYQYVVSYQVIVLGKCSTTGGRAPGTTDCWGSLLEKQLCMKGPGSPG